MGATTPQRRTRRCCRRPSSETARSPTVNPLQGLARPCKRGTRGRSPLVLSRSSPKGSPSWVPLYYPDSPRSRARSTTRLSPPTCIPTSPSPKAS
eukprot:3417874-Prymnesium_polylepis.1